jgi:hypothetical protein
MCCAGRLPHQATGGCASFESVCAGSLSDVKEGGGELMNKLLSLIGSLFLVVGIVDPGLADALGTGFTYQGKLDSSGSPVNDTVHMRFSLWDAAGSGTPPVGGAQLGTSQILSSVPVAGGVFTVLLDDADQFGANAFNGDARWLQIEVCSDPACNSSTVLSPRQPVTPAPYARFAAGPWVKNGNNLSFTGGHVGIGTSNPVQELHLFGTVSRLGLQSTDPSIWTTTEYMANGRTWHTGVGGSAVTNGLANKYYIYDYNAGQARMVVDTLGKVGMGTTSPTETLDVRGNIRLGISGQYYVTAGPENLRTLRGNVNSDGTIAAGSGFWVEHPGTGYYIVHFDTSFLGTPTVTATAIDWSNFTGVKTAQLAAGSVVILTFLSESGHNQAFSFIAVGPR